MPHVHRVMAQQQLETIRVSLCARFTYRDFLVLLLWGHFVLVGTDRSPSSETVF